MVLEEGLPEMEKGVLVRRREACIAIEREREREEDKRAVIGGGGERERERKWRRRGNREANQDSYTWKRFSLRSLMAFDF